MVAKQLQQIRNKKLLSNNKIQTAAKTVESQKVKVGNLKKPTTNLSSVIINNTNNDNHTYKKSPMRR
mgnify:CR=1 FL=1